MKAAVCHEPGAPLEIEDLVLESPKAGEVKVEVRACAICQSDLHYLSGAWPGRPLPAVCGHEVAGTVVEAGGESGAIGEGARVLVSLVRNCGQCRYCRAGRSFLCEGTLPIDREGRLKDRAGDRVYQALRTGGFAEQIVVHHSQAVPIPEDLPFDQAGLLACGVLTGFGAAVNTARVAAGSSVAVIGLGGVGMNCIQGAAIAGAETVIAIDVAPQKFALARALGATHTLDPKDGQVEAAVLDLTEGLGPDYVLVAAGNSAAMELGGEILSKMGRMVIAGLPPAGVTAKLQPRLLVNKNQTIMGTKMGSGNLAEDVGRLIGLYREGRLKLAELIADRFPLAAINEAIAAAGQGTAARNVIVFE